MRNIITCFLVMAFITVQAQQEGLEVIPKGTKFIGGSLYANFNGSDTKYPNADDNNYKTTSFSIGPVGGKYIRDNVSIGLGFGYGFSTYKDEFSDGTDTKGSSHLVGVNSFIRKNYKLFPNIFFFLQAETGLSYIASKNINTTDTESKSHSYSAGLWGSPGFQLFLGKKFSLETNLGSIGYRFTQSRDKDSDVYTNMHYVILRGGLDAINFSLKYYIFQ